MEPRSSESTFPGRVVGLDHVVLVVRDIERSVRWYAEQLGLEVERLEEWRAGRAPFVSLRVAPGTIIDLLEGDPEVRNPDHVAFVLEDVDLDELADSGRFEVDRGPADLSGARGTGRAMYVLDPDGQRVELRSYPPDPG